MRDEFPEIEHWTNGFDWENADYIVEDFDGVKTGPIKGKQAMYETVIAMLQKTGEPVTIYVASHDEQIAMTHPETGELMVYDLHDYEGNRLPYRADL